MIGRTLGGYRIVEQIGMGGMATVYKAYDASTDRYVALKTLPQQYSKDPQFVERFRREALAIAKLEHLHILPLFTFGEDEGVSYLVMRYLPAGTLSDRIRQMEQMPLDEAARLLGQIAGALDHAHAHGVLHRDVKPSNVLVDGDGNVYLTDFGIARMVEGTLDLTGDSILGTPQYMSPEQCQGRKDLSAASDQYSLGVVLYEMVTGQTPFQAETPLAVIHMQLMGSALPLPSVVRTDLPGAAERVILKALSREPGERYESCGALAKAFAAAIQAQPAATARAVVGAPTVKADPTDPILHPQVDAPTTRLNAPRPATQRSPMVWIGGAAVVVVIAVVALLAGRGAGETAPSPTPEASAVVAAVASSTLEITSTHEATVVPSPTSAPSVTPAPSATSTAETGPVADLVTAGEGFASKGNFKQAVDTFSQALDIEPDNVDLLVKRGQALQQDGDTESALIDYARALEADPKSVDALQARAELYRSQGDLGAALEDLAKALDVMPTDAALLVLRGKTFFEYGDYDSAKADLTAAIEAAPDMTDAYVQRAIVFMNVNDRKAALADLTQALKLDKDSPEIYALRGMTYRDESQYDLALGDYRKAIELDPENPQWHFDRATVYSWRGDYESAITSLDKVIELDPQMEAAYIRRAENHSYLQQYKEALEDYAAARKINPENLDAYQGPVQVFLDAQDYGIKLKEFNADDALNDADRAVELAPEDSNVVETRGKLHSLRGEHAEAIADFTRSIELYAYAGVYTNRGDEYLDSGDYVAAEADFSRAIEMYQDDVRPYQGRIEAYMQSMDDDHPLENYDLDKALEDANQAVKIAEYDSVSFLLRGKVYGRMGEHEKALQDLGHAIELSNDMAWAYEERGYVYGMMGDFKAAEKDFKQAIKLEPDNPWNYAALGDLYYDNDRPKDALKQYQEFVKHTGDGEVVDYIRERIAELK